MQAELHFSKSTPILKYGAKVSSIESAELQVKVITDNYQPTHTGEGSSVRIKVTSDTGSETSNIGDENEYINSLIESSIILSS